jgi:hypothetical protein
MITIQPSSRPQVRIVHIGIVRFPEGSQCRHGVEGAPAAHESEFTFLPHERNWRWRIWHSSLRRTGLRATARLDAAAQHHFDVEPERAAIRREVGMRLLAKLAASLLRGGHLTAIAMAVAGVAHSQQIQDIQHRQQIEQLPSLWKR